jgi:hypothetical protein
MPCGRRINCWNSDSATRSVLMIPGGFKRFCLLPLEEKKGRRI